MRTLVAILAFVFAPAAGAAYKCVDEKGNTHVGDTPPLGCAHVVMYETSRSGNVIRKIEPTPTAEQLKVRQEQARRQEEADKVWAEQKRRDTALLTTFSSEKEFDFARDRNIEPLNGRIRSAQERIREIDKRLAKIDEEMEFYRAGKSKSRAAQVEQPPQGLVAEQGHLHKEKQTLLGTITTNERDIAAQHARFDGDKKRWAELRAGAVKPGDPPQGAAPTLSGK